MRTKNSIIIALGLFGLTATSLKAQIAINNSAATPNASAILDLQTGNAGVNKGFLPQSVALTNVTTAAPVTSPATGLLVYSSTAPTGGNGTGYYYWNGSAWASMNSNVYGSGTNNYVARWTPNGNTLGTGMIQDNGTTVGVNSAPSANYMVSVNASTQSGIYGYTSYVGTGYGIYGEDDNYIGVEGYSSGNGEVGVYGLANNGAGVFGIADNANYGGVQGSNPLGEGVFGDGLYGVYGYGSSTGGYFTDGADYCYAGYSGYGLYGSGDTGVTGYTNSALGSGVTAISVNQNAVVANGGFGGIYSTGAMYGVVGEDAPTLTGDYGFLGLNEGFHYGVYAYGATAGGILFDGTGDAADIATGGYGVYGSGADTGVTGYSTNIAISAVSTTNDAVYVHGEYGGAYASGGTGYGMWAADGAGDYAIIAADFGNSFEYGIEAYGASIGAIFSNPTDYSYLDYSGYGILSNGVKSTMVKDENNKERVMYCNESPEVKFEDYGEGQLVGGKAHITLDPILAKNVTINEKHPLQAFVQLEGDCNGVYVTNKSVSGFDVIELNHGTSNTAFSWHIVANRAARINDNGTTTDYANWRFPVGPDRPEMKEKPSIANSSGKANHTQAIPTPGQIKVTTSSKSNSGNSASAKHVNVTPAHKPANVLVSGQKMNQPNTIQK